MVMLKEIPNVLDTLEWMQEHHIWPNGVRYLWTDAFGLILYVSLFLELNENQYIEKAEHLIREVERVLGRPHGLRIGQQPDRDGQYYHYLMMWIYALFCMGIVKPEYKKKAVDLAKDIHPYFVVPEVGVYWKMREDLSGVYPGYGWGGLDPFNGYVTYRLLGEPQLRSEIKQLYSLVESSYREMNITQDLGLGMMLWLCHFFPGEPWAEHHRKRSLETLDTMWASPSPGEGYFCRHPFIPDVKFAFTNYGISVGLQAVGSFPERIQALHAYFKRYKSYTHYDTDAITHVMACSSYFPGLLLKPYLNEHGKSAEEAGER